MAYFQTQNPKFGSILEGITMDDVGIFHWHLVYFMDIWYILWYFNVLVCCTKKNLATLPGEPTSPLRVNVTPRARLMFVRNCPQNTQILPLAHMPGCWVRSCKQILPFYRAALVQVHKWLHRERAWERTWPRPQHGSWGRFNESLATATYGQNWIGYKIKSLKREFRLLL
jgi:hypothetical protein